MSTMKMNRKANQMIELSHIVVVAIDEDILHFKFGHKIETELIG